MNEGKKLTTPLSTLKARPVATPSQSDSAGFYSRPQTVLCSCPRRPARSDKDTCDLYGL